MALNSANKVASMIAEWKASGLSKAEIIRRTAEACIGWPYAWGSCGEYCTPEKRTYYMNRSSIGQGDAELIRKRCQVLNGTKASCYGCKYYPGGERTRIFDCRGFTRWLLAQVGLTLKGAGATSQWNSNSNWQAKGYIKDAPTDEVSCAFKAVGNKMEHTGMIVGNGEIIHCSVEVKKGKTTDKGWTQYATPKGIEGGILVWRSTIRKGSANEDVKYCQERLIEFGYDLGPSGADGKFGNKTKAAVMAFQKSFGLTADGVVGPLTWEKIESIKPKETTETYTVTIPGLSLEEAEALLNKYPGSKKELIG